MCNNKIIVYYVYKFVVPMWTNVVYLLEFWDVGWDLNFFVYESISKVLHTYFVCTKFYFCLVKVAIVL